MGSPIMTSKRMAFRKGMNLTAFILILIAAFVFTLGSMSCGTKKVTKPTTTAVVSTSRPTAAPVHHSNHSQSYDHTDAHPNFFYPVTYISGDVYRIYTADLPTVPEYYSSGLDGIRCGGTHKDGDKYTRRAVSRGKSRPADLLT